MSDHVLTGDEPVDAGGGGLGPSPFELLSAALAECTAMTVRWYARQQRWPVDHVSVVVDYEKRQPAGASSPVDVFEKTIFIRGSQLTDQQRSRLFDVASKCPVQRVLESSPSIKSELKAISDR
ncbi:OsmC family protein [Bradyrhizobium sp. RT6a]